MLDLPFGSFSHPLYKTFDSKLNLVHINNKPKSVQASLYEIQWSMDSSIPIEKPVNKYP